MKSKSFILVWNNFVPLVFAFMAGIYYLVNTWGFILCCAGVCIPLIFVVEYDG